MENYLPNLVLTKQTGTENRDDDEKHNP